MFEFTKVTTMTFKLSSTPLQNLRVLAIWADIKNLIAISNAFIFSFYQSGNVFFFTKVAKSSLIF